MQAWHSAAEGLPAGQGLGAAPQAELELKARERPARRCRSRSCRCLAWRNAPGSAWASLCGSSVAPAGPAGLGKPHFEIPVHKGLAQPYGCSLVSWMPRLSAALRLEESSDDLTDPSRLFLWQVAAVMHATRTVCWPRSTLPRQQ